MTLEELEKFIDARTLKINVGDIYTGVYFNVNGIAFEAQYTNCEPNYIYGIRALDSQQLLEKLRYSVDPIFEPLTT